MPRFVWFPLVATVLGLLSLGFAPLSFRFQFLAPRPSFQFLLVGLVLLALGFSSAFFLWLKYRQLDPQLITRVLLFTAISLLPLAIPLYGFFQARKLPMIHDISTDTEDPPLFEDILSLRADATNPAEYAGKETADLQKAAYPDIKPLELEAEPQDAFARCLEAARKMNWQIVSAQPNLGRIEAVATTFLYGFKDDIVIRIRPISESRTQIDVRSKSRIGRSDLGANAKRIREFLSLIR